jgi:hypothetical protein
MDSALTFLFLADRLFINSSPNISMPGIEIDEPEKRRLPRRFSFRWGGGYIACVRKSQI